MLAHAESEGPDPGVARDVEAIRIVPSRRIAIGAAYEDADRLAFLEVQSVGRMTVPGFFASGVEAWPMPDDLLGCALFESLRIAA